MAEEIKTREQFEVELNQKAWADKAFLAELRDNPKKVLEREAGHSFPADLEIKVVEESPKVAYFRLHPDPNSLSEEELEAVAGGGYFSSIVNTAKKEVGDPTTQKTAVTMVVTAAAAA